VHVANGPDVLLCLWFLVLSVRGWTDEQVALQARVHRAAELTSLDWAGLRPWHLRLAVEAIGTDGKAQAQGTIEEWWASSTLNRVVYTTPAYKGAALQNADGFYRSIGAGPEDADMEMLLRQVVHPMPTLTELDLGMLVLRSEEVGKVKLDCVMLGQTIRGVGILPLGLFPTYCLDPGGDSLRLTYDFGGLYIVRNRMGKFLDRTVPLEEAVSSSGRSMLRAKIETLQTAALTEADFVPGADMQKADQAPARVPSGVMSGQALNRIKPAYPIEAKQKRMSGAVVLHATIGRDGHVHSLIPISYPEGLLAVSAIAAVRQWTYKPYLVNGEPTEVETTITVNYNISY